MPAAKNIAVIAVHGVGRHEPFASARAIADLLLRTPRDRSPDYTSFTEEEIQIATRAVDHARDATDPAPAPQWLAVSERSAHPRIQDDPFGPDHLLMSHQLNGSARRSRTDCTRHYASRDDIWSRGHNRTG